ncbi:MAG: type II toxin-antitoxin system Phd/YefM family antitoxin [Candidatus Binatia bacterium]
MAKPERVGSRELKTRLGRYLRKVREGATLVVTERGRPVAEVRPIRSGDSVTARLRGLERLGVLTCASTPSLPAFRPIRPKGGSVSEAIVEGRRDRF